MYNYLHSNQIHCAPGYSEALKEAGFALPEGIDPINHYIVRIWHWNENEKDYSIEVFDAPGHQVFQEYNDALTCFNALESDFSKETGKEIKLELVQYHRGKITTYYSKILFPPIMAR